MSQHRHGRGRRHRTAAAKAIERGQHRKELLAARRQHATNRAAHHRPRQRPTLDLTQAWPL